MASSGPPAAEVSHADFRPALIVVDVQEDFCPPNGTLAVPNGRSIAPIINQLLALRGFVVRVATQDFHPVDHVSFATNHSPPNNRPYESFIEMKNPAVGKKESETKPQRLWPVHCVQESPGAAIIPEIEIDKIDVFVTKGMDARVEMYSAFADAFGNDSLGTGVNIDLSATLRERNVSDVFVVGIAGDYCVKSTAIDSVRKGFKTWVVEEAVKSVDPGAGWEAARKELAQYGVGVISAGGPELARIKAL
ncbi:hypothetical protein AJ80_07813 [Polytolypa hystricis UAMH7299]|uniref:nicotinamidase n=1 Tax=Polytolypa hystricis (strain UAMH7299) TaxID=1447883 RepID=A0A2B7XJ16_POLH7|nr:hypothetical protein AJ80_07813 [Polytolypa hystricis UAMH7299]